jgi:probable DNA metabolism protein
MPERTALIYCYDGSFDGLLCCVFESYDRNELPSDVLTSDSPLPLLLPVRQIQTIPDRARRVLNSIPQKMGRDAPDFLRRAFLTCHPRKDILILEFLRIGYRVGPTVMRMLTDETVHELNAAVFHLNHEAHLYTGFVRFSEYNGALAAVIEPKNNVLPLIAPHFVERFPEEQFLIYDKTHGLALVYADRAWTISSVQELSLPTPSEEEKTYRALWRMFYNTIEIKERHNPRCRAGHMPKRYWGCLTEFLQDEEIPAEGGARKLLSGPNEK